MNDDQMKFQNCAHCGVRLYANATSSLCKNCRFQGHKEFGTCDKCPKEEIVSIITAPQQLHKP